MKKLEIGQRFSKLIILQNFAGGKVEVRCDCGTVKTILKRSLIQGSAKSCGLGKCHQRYLDLDGQRFGKLLVLRSDLPNSKVLVRCDCNLEFEVQKSSITSGNSKSCGQGLCHAATKDLTGETFGYLKVIKFLEGKTTHNYGTLWECLCECGSTHNVVSHSLVTGQTKSCGCKTAFIYSKSATLPENMAVINGIYASYKLHAKKLKIKFLLTREDFEKLIQDCCHYCGSGLSNIRNLKNITGPKNYKYNGIDRKDSALDYELDNCVTACQDCNYAKGKRSYDEFINHSKVIASRFK